MGFLYQATVYVFKALPNGEFADVAEQTRFTRVNHIAELKNEVNNFVIQQMNKHNCLVEILYERNGEYYDSEEIQCVDGEVA